MFKSCVKRTHTHTPKSNLTENSEEGESEKKQQNRKLNDRPHSDRMSNNITPRKQQIKKRDEDEQLKIIPIVTYFK